MINFVINRKNQILLEKVVKRDIDTYWNEFVYSYPVWLVQTYYFLNKYSDLDITYASKPIINKINVVHVDYFRYNIADYKCFYCILLSDKEIVPFGATYIVQNRSQIINNNFYWVPHWPQPNLKFEDENKLERIGYAGMEFNFNCKLIDFFRSNNFSFKFIKSHEWNNYLDIDIIVAIRDFSSNLHDEKPPTKLLNAWKAKKLFISGSESAYRQLGIPNINYIEVNSIEELQYVLSDVKSNMSKYKEIINNGYIESLKYTNLNISLVWENVLKNQISVDFNSFKKPMFIKFYKNLFLYKVKNYSKAVVLKTKNEIKKIKIFGT